MTMIGNQGWTPDERGDAWREALFCYRDFAEYGYNNWDFNFEEIKND
jgi:hypothetical protein